MATRTHTTFFDREQVDEFVGLAYRALASDLESRRRHIDPQMAARADARLELLRVAWLLLLDPAD